MVSSLFSVFDPSSSFSSLLPVKWVSILAGLFILGFNFWVTGDLGSIFLRISKLPYLTKPYFGSNYKMFVIMLTALFLQVFFVNVLGLTPYSFTPSSHLSFDFSLSSVGWLAGVLFMISRSWVGFLAHLVPHGSPMILVPFMVLIETVSLLMRPVSLGVRLMANIMGGHVIMSLAGDSVFLFGSLGFPLLVGVSTILLVFELCVALIQAYVFWNLMTLYWEEGSLTS